MKKFLALFHARNREFLRDTGTLAWNFLFPFLAIVAVGVAFSGTGRDLYKVGVIGQGQEGSPAAEFLSTRYVQFVQVGDLEKAQEKVQRHQLDLLLDLRGAPRYWVNETNPKGYTLERMLPTSVSGQSRETKPAFARQVLSGREIRYVDWLLPGVLGMNMMFSCLFGVGYVIVRYRKGGILRRFKVTPINAVHFITAQVASRWILVMAVNLILFFGSYWLLDLYVVGTFFELFVVFGVGAFNLIALGLLIASRTSSQELAGGLLNFAIWPMMFLSGVWFSLEGSPQWLITLARVFPLTHMIDAARAIMVDGAGLGDVLGPLGILGAMSVVFIVVGAWAFRWD